MDTFPINPNILLAINMLEKKGFSAYIVGGALRDFILDLPVADYDIATNATLDEAMGIFSCYECKKYISKNLTIGVKLNHTYFELSSFKGATIEEDLSNRDFSINSLAYNPTLGLIDPYHALPDFVDKKLRCIKSEEEVLTKDPLRILRALRFMATRGFKPTVSLKNALNKYAYLLKDIKKERISKELNQVFLADTPSLYIREYKSVFFALFPMLEACLGFDQKCPKWHNLDVLEHILKVMDSTKPDLALRIAAFFHDIGKPECFTIDEQGTGHFYGHWVISMDYARKMLEEYAYNHKFIDRVCHIIYYHDLHIEDSDDEVLSFLYKFGTRDLDLLLAIKRADILAQNPSLYDRLYEIDNISERIKRLLEENKIITYKNLKINGDILVELGYQKEEIGKALRIILEKVINKKLKNNPEKLYKYAEELRFHLDEIE